MVDQAAPESFDPCGGRLLEARVEHRVGLRAEPDGPRVALARFYIERLLPEHAGLLAHAQGGADDLYALSVEELVA